MDKREYDGRRLRELIESKLPEGFKGDIYLPDYENCPVNVTASILKSFGVEPPHNTLKILDKYLEKKYKNVVLFLLDGMGTAIMKKHFGDKGFFSEHKIADFSSVYPPTTVAATTSYLCGLTPREHSWLGWDLYYKDIDSTVSVFHNLLTGTDTIADKISVPWTYYPYDSIILKIQEAGYHAYYAAPHEMPYPKGLQGVLDRVSHLCSLDQRKFIYAYIGEPDHTMHRNGSDSEVVHELLLNMQDTISKWSENFEDTLFIFLADHGHMNVRGVTITDYTDLYDCLERMPSMDVRTVTFFVKEGMNEKFAGLFEKYFGNDFILLSHDEAGELLGIGRKHPKYDEMVGDFVAVAISDLALFPNNEKRDKYKSHHSGLTRDEMEIPLMILER